MFLRNQYSWNQPSFFTCVFFACLAQLISTAIIRVLFLDNVVIVLSICKGAVNTFATMSLSQVLCYGHLLRDPDILRASNSGVAIRMESWADHTGIPSPNLGNSPPFRRRRQVWWCGGQRQRRSLRIARYRQPRLSWCPSAIVSCRLRQYSRYRVCSRTHSLARAARS